MMCNAFISGYQIQDKCTLKIKLKKKTNQRPKHTMQWVEKDI